MIAAARIKNTGIFHCKAAKEEDIEDKKLIAAIVGAITAYIQMEQQPPPASPGRKLVGYKSPATTGIIEDNLER